MPETAVIAWALAKWLGLPIAFLSFLTVLKVRLLEIDFNAIPEPYKNVMYFFTTITSLCILWERIQKGLTYREQRRKMKIENDHTEWKNKLEQQDTSSSHKK